MYQPKHPASWLMAALVLSVAVPAFSVQYSGSDSQSRDDRSNQSQPAQGQSSQSAYSGQNSQAALSAKKVIQDWKETPRRAAQQMIKKYGEPEEVTEDRLVWHDNGPWKRTEVINEEIDHRFPLPHKDVLLQVVAYQVPADKFDELAAFDGSVMAERTRGEIGARCDKEEANILALNLADEVVTGKRSPADARKIYGEQVVALAKGKPASYAKELNFRPQLTAADADRTTLDKVTADEVTRLIKEKEEKMARAEASEETM